MSEESPSEDTMMPDVACFLCCPLGGAAIYYPSKVFEATSDKSPSDHLLLAMLACLLCCPLGSAALFCSSETRRHNHRNERAKAVKTSHQAFILAVSAIISGCVTILLVLGVFLTILLKR